MVRVETELDAEVFWCLHLGGCVRQCCAPGPLLSPALPYSTRPHMLFQGTCAAPTPGSHTLQCGHPEPPPLSPSPRPAVSSRAPSPWKQPELTLAPKDASRTLIPRQPHPAPPLLPPRGSKKGRLGWALLAFQPSHYGPFSSRLTT